jgi:hypothetical protein
VFLICKYFRFICFRAICLKVLRIGINFGRGYAELVRPYKASVVTDRHRLSLYSPYGFHSAQHIRTCILKTNVFYNNCQEIIYSKNSYNRLLL